LSTACIESREAGATERIFKKGLIESGIPEKNRHAIERQSRTRVDKD